MAQTDTEANHGGLTVKNFVGGSCHILVPLSIRQNAVYIGALAQVILVTNRGHIVFDIEPGASSNTVSLRGVNVTDTEVARTAGKRSTGRSLKGVAFHLAERIQTNIRQAANLANEDFIKVLSTRENLDNAEVITAAEGDRQTVIYVLRNVCFWRRRASATLIKVRSVIHRVNGKIEIDRTVRIGCAKGIVTIG